MNYQGHYPKLVNLINKLSRIESIVSFETRFEIVKSMVFLHLCWQLNTGPQLLLLAFRHKLPSLPVSIRPCYHYDKNVINFLSMPHTSVVMLLADL